jgi:hypothetical protein
VGERVDPLRPGCLILRRRYTTHRRACRFTRSSIRFLLLVEPPRRGRPPQSRLTRSGADPPGSRAWSSVSNDSTGFRSIAGGDLLRQLHDPCVELGRRPGRPVHESGRRLKVGGPELVCCPKHEDARSVRLLGGHVVNRLPDHRDLLVVPTGPCDHRQQHARTGTGEPRSPTEASSRGRRQRGAEK